jgi:hypothetical protein
MGKASTATSGTSSLKMEFDEQFCSKCHDPENDNRFLFARDIDLVNHTRTEQRPADAPITRETSGTAARTMMTTETASAAKMTTTVVFNSKPTTGTAH